MITKKSQLLAQILYLFMVIFAGKIQALESSIQLHKVDQEESLGYSLSIGDNFFKQRSFNWQINYNFLENVAIADLDQTSEVWDNADFYFDLHTVDLMLGYRYYPRSYSRFIKSFMFEVQLGASVNLNDHKFVFRPDFDRDDLYFAEQGDINLVLALSLQKSFTKNAAMHIGVKYYPSYSDFGSIGSLFIGFNYRFGRQVGY